VVAGANKVPARIQTGRHAGIPVQHHVCIPPSHDRVQDPVHVRHMAASPANRHLVHCRHCQLLPHIDIGQLIADIIEALEVEGKLLSKKVLQLLGPCVIQHVGETSKPASRQHAHFGFRLQAVVPGLSPRIGKKLYPGKLRHTAKQMKAGEAPSPVLAGTTSKNGLVTRLCQKVGLACAAA